MIAKSLIVREKFTDKQGKPVFFELKHDLGSFKLKDRLMLKSWLQLRALGEKTRQVRAKVQKKEYRADPPNFNRYLWHNGHLLTGKAIKSKSDGKMQRAAALSELGAKHLMGMHEEIKKGDYAAQTSCIIPLIALNNYIWQGHRIPLTDERAKQAAKIASELARTCDNYNSDWAREQLPDALETLGEFLELTVRVKGIEKEREIVRSKLEKGSSGLDEMNATAAYRALLTVGGDEGVAQCRDCIFQIRDAAVQKAAMEKCQEYWVMHWFDVGFQPCELFPPEFTAKLKQMEILKN